MNDISPDSTNDGRANSSMVPNNATFPAFKLCKDLNLGGFNDWYLPSQVELFYLWSVRGLIEAAGNITNFQNADYWSSTESTINLAWGQNFADGDSYNYNKSNPDRVRCMRR